MRLLHITATHLKPDGGVPVVLKELVTEQNQLSDVYSMVISLVAPVEEMESKYFKFITTKNFESFVNEFKPDCVILHSFYYLEYNKVVSVLVKKRIRYFIEPHGSFGKAAMRKSWLKKKIANLTIFRRQINESFGFIFLNEKEKQDSIYRTQNDLVIPNGININRIKKDVNPPKNTEFYYIGRYDINHKGLDCLFDALDILDRKEYDYKINMWGRGNEKATAYIKKRIENFNHIAVYYNESIYGKEKDGILEQYGPMILTSRYEGFPMTILEAWTYGNPCLVTPGTNVFDEVTNNNLGWGVQFNPEDIARGIIDAATSYEKKKKTYIESCKKYVATNYSWKIIAERSVSEIDNLLK